MDSAFNLEPWLDSLDQKAAARAKQEYARNERAYQQRRQAYKERVTDLYECPICGYLKPESHQHGCTAIRPVSPTADEKIVAKYGPDLEPYDLSLEIE